MAELHQQTAHNYSIQTLNSTELAKEKLRQVLAEVRIFVVCYGVFLNTLILRLLLAHTRAVKSRVLCSYMVTARL